MLSKTSTFLGALVVEAACETGCVADTTPATTTDEDLTSESFRLYAEPGAEVDDRCDVHTVLTLKPFREPGVVHAELRDVLVGDCKRAIDRDPRTYALFRIEDECGSARWAASTTMNGIDRTLTVTDHRTRVCRDRAPARIVVEEEGLPTLYSYDGFPSS